MDTKVIKTTTMEQFALLLREVAKQPELAKYTPPHAALRNEKDTKWDKIAKKLNDIGPPERCRTEWKRVFCHLKARTKRKLTENEEAGFAQHRLTEPEKALEEILKIVEPIKPSSDSFAVPSIKLTPTSTIKNRTPSPISDIAEEPTAEAPSPTPDCTTGAKKRKAVDQSNFLFRRQLQHQIKYIKVTKEIREIMDRQCKCVHRLTSAVERQEELMERQLELMKKQTLAMERQAAALERLAELQ